MHIDESYQERDEPLAVPVRPDSIPPWSMIEPGRYQPRRIKGSCHGRELG